MLWRDGFFVVSLYVTLLHLRVEKWSSHGHTWPLIFVLVPVKRLEHGLEVGWQGDMSKFFKKEELSVCINNREGLN